MVVVKDLNWGTSTPAFQALVDTGDGKPGMYVAIGITNPWFNSNFLWTRTSATTALRPGPHHRRGPQRRRSGLHRVHDRDIGVGCDVASALVGLMVARIGPMTSGPFPKARIPSLAINSRGGVGFVYQQVVGANWTTILEVSDDGFVSSFLSHILAITPTNTPIRKRPI